MANLFDLVAKLTLDSSEYESGLDKAEGKASSIGGTLKKGLGTAAKAGAAAVGAAAAGVVAFGKQAVSAGMNFDSSMSQVAATMGTTVDQIGELRDFAQQMGSTTTFSATEAADALNYMALAGYDAETSMTMLPNVLNLAAAGGIDLAAASDMVTDASSALGLSLDQTSTLVDQMAKASSMSNTSVAQLGDAILTVGGTAKNLAGGTTELSTALGILADNGIKGAEGGTALRNIILSLSAPTDTAAKKMEELGLSVYDAEGKMRPMEDIFTDLNGALSSMTQGEQTEVLNTLFNKVDLKSANALLATSTDRWNELSTGIDNASGAAQNMAETQLDNLAGDITLFKSALEGAQIAVSDVLSPALREFVQLGTDGISSVTEAFQSGGLEGAADAAGEVIGQLVSKVVEYAPQLVSAAVTLVQSLGSALLQNAPMIIDSALQIVQILVDGLIQSAPTLLTGALQMVAALANGLAEYAPTLATEAVNLITQLATMLTEPATLTPILEGGLAIITGLADSLITALPTLIQAVPVIIQNLVNFIVGAAPQILSAGTQILVQLTQGIITALPSLISAAPLIISSLEQGIMRMLPTILGAGIQLLQQLTLGVLQAIPSLVAQVPMIVQSFVAGFTGNFGAFLETGVQLLIELAKGVMQGASILIQDIPQIITQVAQAFMNGLPDMLNAGKQLISGLWDGIKGAFSGKKGEVKVADNVDFSGINEKAQQASSSMSSISSAASQTASSVTSSFSSISTAADFTQLGTNATTAFTGISTSAQTAATTVTESFSSVGTGVSENINTGIQAVEWGSMSESASETVSSINKSFSELPPQLKAIFEMIKQAVRDLHRFVKEQFTQMAKDAVNAWQPVPGQINTYLQQINTNVTTLATNIRTTFETLVGGATQWGHDLVENFASGIENNMERLTGENGAITRMAQAIQNNTGFSEPKEGPLSNFHTYAPDMMKLFAQGVEENTDLVQNQVRKSFDFRQPEITYSKVSSGRSASGTDRKLDELTAILTQYLPQLANMQVVMNSGVTVGALLPEIDSQLGQRYRVKERAGA